MWSVAIAGIRAESCPFVDTSVLHRPHGAIDQRIFRAGSREGSPYAVEGEAPPEPLGTGGNVPFISFCELLFIWVYGQGQEFGPVPSEAP